MSTLAYGWVERCSDVAGCGRVLYKISVLHHFASIFTFTVYCLMNYDEHVVCLNECMFAFAMYMKDYAS